MNIVHTMASQARTAKRRYYSPELKLQVVAACARANSSIAGVAMQHGVNANIVHRWLREHSQGTLVAQPLAFVPVTLQSSTEVAAPVSAAQATGEPEFDSLESKETYIPNGINSLAAVFVNSCGGTF